MNLKDFIDQAQDKRKNRTQAKSQPEKRLSLDEISRKIGAYSVSNYLKMQKAIKEEEEKISNDKLKTKSSNFNTIV